jgi:hypothetical protein
MKGRVDVRKTLRTVAVGAAMLSVACSKHPNAETEVRRVTPGELHLDRDSGTPVISSAQKFIIPVPAFRDGGEPLVYPKGDQKAGQPILDYEGKAIGRKGLVFFNAKDRSRQAVAGDGRGVIIVNEVTPEQASRLDEKIRSLQPDPGLLTLAQLKEVLDFARDQLGLGDVYNSDREFIAAKMTAVAAIEPPRINGRMIEPYGLMKRDDRDLCYAVHIPGKFVFEGPAASPQVFDNGGVIVRQGDAFRGVQPDIFLRTYRMEDGRTIASPTELAQRRELGN